MRFIQDRWTRFVLDSVLVALLLSMSAACSTMPPPQGPIDDESSAVGIALKMRQGPLKLTSKTPEVVLFVKLEEEESVAEVLNKEALIPSTFADGEQVYLLNVFAGTYVAVAALYAVDIEPTNVPVASTNVGSDVTASLSMDMFGGEDTYRNYFSRELIEQTKTTVGSGEFAFMGRFVTNQSTTFGDGDDAQMHILKVLEGKDEAAGFVGDLFSSDHARRLSLHEADTDKSAGHDFYKRAKKHLKGTAWVNYMDEHMAR